MYVFHSFVSQVEGEIVPTLTAQRGPESSFMTQPELMALPESVVSMETVEELRCDLEQRLATWSTTHVMPFYTLFKHTVLDFFYYIYLFVFIRSMIQRARILGEN